MKRIVICFQNECDTTWNEAEKVLELWWKKLINDQSSYIFEANRDKFTKY